MGNLFGVRRRVPAVTVTDQDRTILQIKQQRDKIKIYQGRVESQLDNERQLAIKLLKNNMKDRALVILRKKKFMEDALRRTDNQLATLEQMVHDIEFSQIQVSVVEGLKAGTEALKQLNSVISIDNLQQILEDNEEASEKQKEISILLSGTERYEDDELMKDFEEYTITQKLDEDIEVPTHEPKPQLGDITTLVDFESQPKEVPVRASQLERSPDRKSEPPVPQVNELEPKEAQIDIAESGEAAEKTPDLEEVKEEKPSIPVAKKREKVAMLAS